MNNNDNDNLYSNLSFAFTALIAVTIFFLVFREASSSPPSKKSDAHSNRNDEPSLSGKMATSSTPMADNSDDNNNDKFILLLGVEDQLFKSCFGTDEEWLSSDGGCRIESLPEDCSASQLRSILTTGKKHKGMQQLQLQSIVIQDDVEHPHWNEIKNYYKNGGFVVFFGIFGEFAAPARISKELGDGMDWKFSGYTKHEYVLTSVAQTLLGDAVTKQQYTKCNLLSVPQQDRLMLPETLSLRKFVEEHVGIDPDDDHEEFEKEMDEASRRNGSYERYCRQNETQCPLALHKNESHGGRFAYLGFVNGDGNIPQIVRALVSGNKMRKD